MTSVLAFKNGRRSGHEAADGPPVVAVVEPRSSGRWLLGSLTALGARMGIVASREACAALPGECLGTAEFVSAIANAGPSALERAVTSLGSQILLSAVIAGSEEGVVPAAYAAAALGVRGLRCEAALSLHYKDLMRASLAEAGIAQPLFAAVTRTQQVARACEAVGLPCVVKPAGCSGSRMVRRCNTLDEALEAVGTALSRSVPEHPKPVALVEEYVEGPEYSVEGFIGPGGPEVIGVTEKLLGPEPWFVERGHLHPAELSEEALEKVRAYAVTVVDTLGLSMGVFHAELRLSSRGPLLMEVAARLPGDRIPLLVSLTGGPDIYEIYLRSHLGQQAQTLLSSLTTHLPGRPQAAGCARVAGVGYFLRPGLRRYDRVDIDPVFAGDTRVREANVLLAAGTDLPPPQHSGGRLGYAVVTGDDHSEVRALLGSADDAYRFS